MSAVIVLIAALTFVGLFAKSDDIIAAAVLLINTSNLGRCLTLS